MVLPRGWLVLVATGAVAGFEDGSDEPAPDERRPERPAARLQAELDTVLGGRPPAQSDLARLPYTLQVLKETMRLFPPANLFGRAPTEDIEVEGYGLRKGQFLIISPYVIHRHPEFFPEPERFEELLGVLDELTQVGPNYSEADLKSISVPVGEEVVGRVVNSLGQPVDGKGPIVTGRFAPIERIASTPSGVCCDTLARKMSPVEIAGKAIDAAPNSSATSMQRR